jgi:hypothetical protein
VIGPFGAILWDEGLGLVDDVLKATIIQ